jgi:DNA-binding transcriptional MocR family regulator
MKSTPKHQAITSQLATEILAGKYGRTGRLPSEVQLVKRFGVARPTIGQALRAFPNRSAYDLVGIDNFAGGYLLAEHLIKLGLRRLASTTSLTRACSPSP